MHHARADTGAVPTNPLWFSMARIVRAGRDKSGPKAVLPGSNARDSRTTASPSFVCCVQAKGWTPFSCFATTTSMEFDHEEK